MAVDEFGREIPAARRRGDRGSSPSPSYGSPSRGPDGAPRELYEALSSSRYGRDSRDNNNNNNDRNRKRKHRSESPPPSSRRSNKPQPHPSTLYAEEPMLCQFLWKEANPDKNDDDYNEYRRGYCLNYVRTFFNEHMDDSWFRSLYSPLGKHRVALQERERALKEASEFKAELDASLADGSERDGRCYFVLKARLGGGVRHNASKTYFSGSTKNINPNPVPATHVLASSSRVLPIMDVPAHVTEEQLTMALMKHSKQDSKDAAATSLILYSSPPRPDLTRTSYLYAPDEVRKDIINQLNLDRGGGAATSSSGDGAHVPRKEETFVPKLLELEVDCSDAYGRVEIDSDGKGGAPEDGAVPPRKASVWVFSKPLLPNVQVLSAAVSSKERIKGDQESALQLAKAYDLKRNVSPEYNLEAILAIAIPGLGTDDATPQDVEDALDVSVAYLRRVHLFSFYNGCTSSSNVAEVFQGKHPTSTIHLRLANADEILQENKKDEPAAAPAEASDEPPKVDLLVQRLNTCIDKALSACSTWDENAGMYIVSEEIDGQAKQIEELESQVEGGWMEDHALVDEDGRARCSFHFCRKLFKDASFLKKHLIKKHYEFLRAEMAKCHDSYMMTAWDTQERRPVPPILVECGRAFSTVPSPVIGAAEPLAEDPEPELWRKQEERRKFEEEEAEARRERYQQQQQQDRHPAPDLDSPLPEERPAPRNQNFVDVDDMKIEKVEMAFDSVVVPVDPPKKKKKKRKLL